MLEVSPNTASGLWIDSEQWPVVGGVVQSHNYNYDSYIYELTGLIFCFSFTDMSLCGSLEFKFFSPSRRT